MAKPIYIKVGGSGPYDPSAGSSACNIPFIKGMEMYVEKAGSGTMAPDTYAKKDTGGFTVTTPFVLDDEYFVHLSGFSYGTDASDYSNGFCLSKVMSALFGRVGWLSFNSPITLNSNNQLSKSGRYFNDGSFHALCTLENIKWCMEKKDATDSEVNSYIEQLQKSIIIRSLNGVFSEPEYLQQTLLYSRHNGTTALKNNDNKFTGIRIEVPKKADLSVKIDSVALLFNEDVTFNLYLFNDAKAAPVWVEEVTAEANTQTIVDIENMILSHVGNNNLSGVFYLGYFQSELGTAKAIREANVCFEEDTLFAFSMFEADKIDSNDFNRSQIGYLLDTVGINAHVSVFRDHTQNVVKNPSLFDNVIGLQMAAQVVELVLFSKRSNTDERILKDQGMQLGASMDLTGSAPITNGPHTTGLRSQISKELQRLKDSFYKKRKSYVVSEC